MTCVINMCIYLPVLATIYTASVKSCLFKKFTRVQVTPKWTYINTYRYLTDILHGIQITHITEAEVRQLDTGQFQY